MAQTGDFWTTLPGVLTALGGLIAAVGSLIGVLYSNGVLGKKSRKSATDEGTARSPDQSSAPGSDPPAAANLPVISLRSAPAILSSEKMDAMLVRLDLFDSRRNPGGRGILHRFESRVDGTMPLVVDAATGLTWDVRGTPRAGTFDDCRPYVDNLNAARAGGFADWRVPTAEELMSLMDPEPTDDFHISPLFRRGGNFFWTADRTQVDEGAWVVYFANGCIDSEQLAFNAWVRAVR